MSGDGTDWRDEESLTIEKEFEDVSRFVLLGWRRQDEMLSFYRRRLRSLNACLAQFHVRPSTHRMNAVRGERS